MKTGLIIGVVIEMAAGILCIIFGLLIWKKQKVSLLHDYQYKNVREADVPAYSRMIGIGLIIIGIGICLTGIINLSFQTLLSLIALGVGFVFGIAVLCKAQKRYNGSGTG